MISWHLNMPDETDLHRHKLERLKETSATTHRLLQEELFLGSCLLQGLDAEYTYNLDYCDRVDGSKRGLSLKATKVKNTKKKKKHIRAKYSSPQLRLQVLHLTINQTQIEPTSWYWFSIKQKWGHISVEIRAPVKLWLGIRRFWVSYRNKNSTNCGLLTWTLSICWTCSRLLVSCGMPSSFFS